MPRCSQRGFLLGSGGAEKFKEFSCRKVVFLEFPTNGVVGGADAFGARREVGDAAVDWEKFEYGSSPAGVV